MSNVTDRLLNLLEETISWYRENRNEKNRLWNREISLKENESGLKVAPAVIDKEDTSSEAGAASENDRRRFESETHIAYTVEGFSIAEGYVLEEKGDGVYHVVRQENTGRDISDMSKTTISALEKKVLPVMELRSFPVDPPSAAVFKTVVTSTEATGVIYEPVSEGESHGLKAGPEQLVTMNEKGEVLVPETPFDVWTLQRFNDIKISHTEAQKSFEEVINAQKELEKAGGKSAEQELSKTERKRKRDYRVFIKKQLDHWVGLKVIGGYHAKYSTVKLQDTLLKVLERVVLEEAEKIISKDIAEEIPENNTPVQVTTGESKADEADTETESPVAESKEAEVSVSGVKPPHEEYNGDYLVTETESTVSETVGYEQKAVGTSEPESETEEQATLSVNGKPVSSAPSAFKIENGVLDTDPDTFGFGFSSAVIKTLENPNIPSNSKDGTEIGLEEFQIVGMKFIQALTEKNVSGALKYAEYIKRTAVWCNPATGKPEYVTRSSQVPVSQYAYLVEGMCAEIKVPFADIVEVPF